MVMCGVRYVWMYHFNLGAGFLAGYLLDTIHELAIACEIGV